MIRGVAQLASALAWGARGRKFESSHPDIEKKKARFLPCFFVITPSPGEVPPRTSGQSV